MTELVIQGSSLNGSLMDLLVAPDIQPGHEPSYQLCKTIYSYHPLGGKMVDSPLKMCQSQERNLTVQEAPEEIAEAFRAEWKKLDIDTLILSTGSLARIYGLSSVVLGVKGVKADQPLDMDQLWEKDIYFNVLDPLNTAGSMVLSQVPTSPDFNKPVTVRTMGETFHQSRYQVLMNERPVYLQYTGSAFGFVGRSVYQRALFPLKSFIRSMIADDIIATKLALLVAKMEAPGSVIDNMMTKITGSKRALLKEAQTGNVLSIGTDEEVTTLDMTNVDGAGEYSRGNILKNVATSGDMPAFFLENETLAEGFGEGTEDAKNIARYINDIRKWLNSIYTWFDNIVQYRAWTPAFYERMQEKYPDELSGMSFEDAFSRWREDFRAEWPSLLIEPESDQVKVDEVRLGAVVSVLTVLLPELDPENKSKLIQWAADNIGSNKLLFEYDLVLDPDTIAEFQDEKADQEEEEREVGLDAQKAAAKGPVAVKKVALGGGKK